MTVAEQTALLACFAKAAAGEMPNIQDLKIT
jgi:hypothetical protein